MSEIFDRLIDESSEQMGSRAADVFKREITSFLKQEIEICFSEEEAAAKLDCSAQTLKRRRDAGEIDYSRNPAGRPVYMLHHLLDYLKRRERRHGRQEVTLEDVLGNNVAQFPKRKAA